MLTLEQCCREGSASQVELERYKELCISLQSQLDAAHADILDFTESSQGLQDELEKDLERLEAGEVEMQRGLEQSKNDAENWKVHSSASTSLDGP